MSQKVLPKSQRPMGDLAKRWADDVVKQMRMSGLVVLRPPQAPWDSSPGRPKGGNGG